MRLLERIRDTGEYGEADALAGFAEFNELAGLPRVAELDRRYDQKAGRTT
jgi:hypothetical protein